MNNTKGIKRTSQSEENRKLSLTRVILAVNPNIANTASREKNVIFHMTITVYYADWCLTYFSEKKVKYLGLLESNDFLLSTCWIDFEFQIWLQSFYRAVKLQCQVKHEQTGWLLCKRRWMKSLANVFIVVVCNLSFRKKTFLMGELFSRLVLRFFWTHQPLYTTYTIIITD